jgi:hypothetical protein
VSDATFACPDLTAFCRLDELGLAVVGQRLEPDRAGAGLPRRGTSLRWALEGIVCQHLTVARVAEGLGVSWNTANAAVLAEGGRVLIDDPHRFDGVTVIGVDEHVWRHTRRGDKYVSVTWNLRRGTARCRVDLFVVQADLASAQVSSPMATIPA